ncbi:alpha/beta fold hydrolase [Aldersonia kunmingensis]|uniref:alpha/beta fold hydrolase n=1 Tax=Aldersonia kunmingensis TaxID=408066 RepID=UPI00083789AA|nr:alpha/beta hydrolase [Aldersonia kunmingensis]
MTSIYNSEDSRRAVAERYRVFLGSWPETTTETVLATGQGDTFIVACGPKDGAPVVLLHDAGFNSAAWTGDVDTWSTTNRVYAVDLIGEPGRSAPSRPALDTDVYAVWLDEVLDGLGLAEAAFVGTSLGGSIALDYALRRPNRVTRLVLLAPSGIGKQKYGALIASMFLAGFGSRGRNAAVDLVLGPRAAPTSGPEAMTFVALDEYRLLAQRSYQPRRDELPVFSDDQLHALGDTPLLVVAGARDRMFDSKGTARRVRKAVPHAEVVLLPRTGHIPVGYTDVVGRFLSAGGTG